MITAKEIKDLRESTGHGLVECKEALTKCLRHVDLAARWLDVKGLAVACAPGRHPRELVEAQAKARGEAAVKS